eukprot:g21205.t1
MGGDAGNNLARLTPGQNLVLGMSAGVLCKAANYPLLVWKNTSQQSLPLSFNPRIVYRGLPMACFNLGATTAVQFFLTGFFQKLLSVGDRKNMTPAKEIQAAFLAGSVSGIPNSLWELCMIQQQRFGGTIFGTPMRLVREQGITSLTRGTIPTVGREGLFTMAMLGLCPVVQTTLMNDYGLSNSTALASGALISALFSATLTHPLDTMKTCMQGDVEQKKYKSMRETGTLIAKEYGVVKGLYKGYLWRSSLICTSFFLINFFKQQLTPVLFPLPDDTPVAKTAKL